MKGLLGSGPMTTDAISALTLSVAQCDRAAFRTLYAAAGARIMGVLTRLLGNQAEAEAALQEVFTRIWHSARSFDPERETGIGWLIALARADAIDRLRARAPSGEDAAPASNKPSVLSRGEGAIVDCLDRLAPERAEAIRSAYLDGLSCEALARRRDMGAGEMGDLLRENLMQIRECLRK